MLEYKIWFSDYLFCCSKHFANIKIRSSSEEKISWLVDSVGSLYFYRLKYWKCKIMHYLEKFLIRLFFLGSHPRKLSYQLNTNRPIRLIFHLDCVRVKLTVTSSAICCLNMMTQQMVLASGKSRFQVMFHKLLSWIQKSNMDF